MATDLKTTHDLALERFKLVVEVERDQRERELQDLKFQAGDCWPDEVKEARKGTPVQGDKPAVPARPMLTIRSLDQPINQVINQARNARLAIKVSPKGDGASQEAAELFEDMIREIEYQSHAQDAYLWAYQREVPAGRGFWRIDKEYEEEAPDPSSPARFDQCLRIRRILNQASVYLDPFAQERDWSDGEFAFITEDVPKARYEREYGTTKLANPPDDAELTSWGDQRPEWFVENNAGNAYRIAEYWFKTYEEEELVEEVEKGREPQRRTIRKPKVMWAKMNGVEFIDPPQEWDGAYIPIVPILFNEFNVGGTRLFEGMVRPATSAAQMLNYGCSAFVENIGLTTRPKYIGYAGQFEGFEDQWDQANTRNLTKLEANAKVEGVAETLPLPRLDTPEPPIQAMTQMVGMFTNFIRSTTGVPDAALGFVNPNDKSGKAIQALQQASEQGTSNAVDGLSRGIQYTGVILADLIPHVYDRPGRKIQTRTADGQLSSVLLNQPFLPIKGEPVPVTPALVQQIQTLPPEQQEQLRSQVKRYDLERAKFTIVCEVGKSYATQREMAAGQLAALAQAAPELVPRYADLWVKEMDIKGSQAISDRLKPPGVDDQDNIPPQIKAAVQQMQQQIQQLSMALQTKQAEQQAKIEVAKLESESRERIAAMNAQAELVKAEASINADNAQAMIKAEFDKLALVLKEKTALMTASAQAAHDDALDQRQKVHEAAMLEREHEQKLEQADTEHDHAKELTAMQPEAHNSDRA